MRPMVLALVIGAGAWGGLPSRYIGIGASAWAAEATTRDAPEPIQAARMLMVEEQYGKAAGVLGDVLAGKDERPKAEAHFLFARCRAAQKQAGLAAGQYQACLDKYPDSDWAGRSLLGLIDLRIAGNDNVWARRLIERCLKDYPKPEHQTQALLKSVVVAARMEDYPTAVDDLWELIVLYPHLREGRMAMASFAGVMRAAGEVEPKFRRCRPALAEHLKGGRFVALAQWAADAGQLARRDHCYTEALACFGRVVAEHADDPYAPIAQEWKAVVLARLDRLDEAEAELDRLGRLFTRHEAAAADGRAFYAVMLHAQRCLHQAAGPKRRAYAREALEQIDAFLKAHAGSGFAPRASMQRGALRRALRPAAATGPASRRVGT